jgi:hypothetical protein
MRRLLAILLVLSSASALAGTCGNGYTYSQHFKLNHAVFPNTDLTDFPVMLCWNGASCPTTSTLPQLKTVGNGGQAQNTATVNGYTALTDMQICDAAASGNALSYYIKPGSYDAATGKLITFTKFSPSHTTDVDYWVFLNNSSVTTSQQDPSGTFAAYQEMWLFDNGTTLNVQGVKGTSTSVNHSATATTGNADGAANFTGGQFIDTGASYTQTGSFSIEAVIYKPSCGSNFQQIGGDYSGSTGWWLYICDAGGSKITFLTPGGQKTSSSTVPLNAWTTVAGTYNTSGTVGKEYINGVDVTGANGGGPASTSATNFYIGNWPVGVGGSAYDGKINLLGIAQAAHSADWEAAMSANQVDPRSFTYQVNTCSGCGTVTVAHSTTGSCTGAGGALTTCTISPAWTVTAGNTLIYSMCVIKNVATVPTISSVTDTLSNTFTAELTTGFNKSASDSQTCALYRAQNITGGTDTSFTATISSGGSTSIWTVTALEVSGLQNTARDASGGNAGPYRVSSGYVPTTNAGDWIVSYAWVLQDGAFPLNVDSSTVPSCLNAAGTLHTVSATNGSDSAEMGLSYCSASATAPNHSEWTRAFASTPDNHNGLVAFPMTPGSGSHRIASQQY